MTVILFLIPTVIAPAVLLLAAQLAPGPGRLAITYVTFPLLLLAWVVTDHLRRGRGR